MKTSLWLVTLPLALSAPSGTRVLETAPLAKRGVSFGSNPVAFNPDQCGSSSFGLASSGQAATRDDCNALVSGLRGLGQHWELTNGGGAGVPKWLDLAWVGSCHFWVDRSNFPDITVTGATLIGTDDVADIVQDSISRFQTSITLQEGGAITLWTVQPAQGTVQCPFNDAGKAPWRIQTDSP